ncbi:hypothetical protein NECAME_03580 [Necator americanus]|uniref:Uncharacterized protein n=1 Tax=Necator americanus TaxID=51031 RepID=W2T376_NECAM|nr:hypothetical protein NECAME_03580 [Necator americanus]ETN76014.1 hypothetical protein NECAME_03580 [Necator americanus]
MVRVNAADAITTENLRPQSAPVIGRFVYILAFAAVMGLTPTGDRNGFRACEMPQIVRQPGITRQTYKISMDSFGMERAEK